LEDMSELFLHMILVAVLLTAVVTDIRSYRIPNWLTVPAMACGLALHVVRHGQQGLLFSLEGLAVGLGLFLVFYATGGMGAGDVKLMAAVGSFLGPLGVLYAGVMTMLLGGLYAVMTMIARFGLRESLARVWALLTTLALPEDMSDPAAGAGSRYQLRYAMVIGLGTMLSQMILVG
jgi:prepilin peptidase CpaA